MRASKPVVLLGVWAVSACVFGQSPTTPEQDQAPSGQTSNSHEQRIQAATLLVDAGKFDQGIASLKQILSEDPASQTAAYELGLAYAAKGDYTQCRSTCEVLAATPGPLQVAALGMLGNCLDLLGQRDQAIEVYRRGLKLHPEDPQIAFNLAITLVENNSLDEARALLQDDTRKNPWHASAHLALGKLFQAQGFRVPAVFSFLRFLALEPDSGRTSDAAAWVQSLLNYGVEKTDGGTKVNVDTNSRKEEGDYSTLEMMLAIVSAGRFTEKSAKLTEFRRAQEQLVGVVNMFLEPANVTQADYTAQEQRPFFAAMEKEKLLEPFIAVAMQTLNLPGTGEWVRDNQKDIDRYRLWIAPQTRRAGVQLQPKP